MGCAVECCLLRRCRVSSVPVELMPGFISACRADAVCQRSQAWVKSVKHGSGAGESRRVYHSSRSLGSGGACTHLGWILALKHRTAPPGSGQ